MTQDNGLIAVLLGNGMLLAIVGYLAVEVRKDVREIRDKVLIMWRWFDGNVGVPAPHNPLSTMPHEDKFS